MNQVICLGFICTLNSICHSDSSQIRIKNLCWEVFHKRTAFPANICWSSRRLQHVFSVTILRLPRRLEDVLKMSSRHLGRRKNVMLKTSSRRLEDMPWRRVEDMSWRRLQDITWRRLQDITWRRLQDISEVSAPKKSKCASSKSMFYKSISDKSRTNASFRTQ